MEEVVVKAGSWRMQKSKECNFRQQKKLRFKNAKKNDERFFEDTYKNDWDLGTKKDT